MTPLKKCSLALIAILAALPLFGATGFTASAQENAADERSCRRSAMPACSELNQIVSFALRTGRQGTAVGSTDPFWTVNGGPANTVTHPAWTQNGPATWISPAASGTDSVSAGEHVYATNLWFDQDPYLYDFVRLNLTLAADNEIVSVTVNGTEVYEGNGGNLDFRTTENFVDFDDANWPWVRGCNEIRVTIRNSEGPSGLSVLGGVRARCSRCLTERPPMDRPAN